MPIQLSERQSYQESSIRALAVSLGKDPAEIWVNPVTGELSIRGLDRVDREHADLGFNPKSNEISQ